jgi:hypothetical protein
MLSDEVVGQKCYIKKVERELNQMRLALHDIKKYQDQYERKVKQLKSENKTLLSARVVSPPATQRDGLSTDSPYGLKASECRQLLDRITKVVYFGSLKNPDLNKMPELIAKLIGRNT